MQYRAKRAEVPSNVDGIKTAQLAYEASFDQFVNVPTPHPRTTVDKQQVAWTTGSGYDTLGWGPDGNVRGAYYVPTSTTDFAATGFCDVDGNGINADYVSTKSSNTIMGSGNNDY
jgi:hypothetical protein